MTAAIEIVPFRAAYSAAFTTLNQAWIERLFVMEEADWKVLREPERSIIEPGGMIYFALSGAEVIGTVASIRESGERYELAKMAVDPARQGGGIGRRLGEAAIEFARAAGGRTMFLLTSSRLRDAVHLYERLGFAHCPLPASGYARADVYMELPL